MDDYISAVTKISFSLETLMWNPWHVKIVRSKEKEKRAVLVFLHELEGLLHPLISKILIAEARLVATGVESNPADTVVNCRVVTMGPVHLQRFSLVDTGGVFWTRSLATDPNRIGGIEI